MPPTSHNLTEPGGPAETSAAPEQPPAPPSPPYRRADFRLLRDTGYGVAVRWTSRTLAADGETRPFAAAVDAFDVRRFAETVAALGAGHVMWSVCGSDFRLCCPSAAVDALLNGRTSRRDLVGELADALAARNIALVLAMDFGASDDAWRAAAGGDGQDKGRVFTNLAEVVGELSRRCGRRCIAWWFEDVRRLIACNGDWGKLTDAGKAAFDGRLVGYNTGVQDFRATTNMQDYSATWVRRVNCHPVGTQTKLGLPWYAMLDWHVDRHSVFSSIRELDQQRVMGLDWPAPSARTLADFYGNFVRVGGTVSFNLLMDQAGRIVPDDLRAMRALRDRLAAGGGR